MLSMQACKEVLQPRPRHPLLALLCLLSLLQLMIRLLPAAADATPVAAE